MEALPPFPMPEPSDPLPSPGHRDYLISSGAIPTHLARYSLKPCLGPHQGQPGSLAFPWMADGGYYDPP